MLVSRDFTASDRCPQFESANVQPLGRVVMRPNSQKPSWYGAFRAITQLDGWWSGMASEHLETLEPVHEWAVAEMIGKGI